MTKKEKLMNNSKLQAYLKDIECTCTCTEGGSDNPYCEVHGTECGCCGGDLTNKACDNHYCSDYDPIAVLTGYKTGENNVKNDCSRCIKLKIADSYHRVRKQSLGNVDYFCDDCDWDVNFSAAADAHTFGEYA